MKLAPMVTWMVMEMWKDRKWMLERENVGTHGAEVSDKHLGKISLPLKSGMKTVLMSKKKQ
jgi:hypothetical protein